MPTAASASGRSHRGYFGDGSLPSADARCEAFEMLPGALRQFLG